MLSPQRAGFDASQFNDFQCTHEVHEIARIDRARAGPSCGGGCDAVFAPGFEIEPIEEHAARMWEQSHLPAVGPTSSGESLNVSEKVGGLINELEKAHIYIERLNEEAKLQKAALADKGQRLAELEGRLFRLEALLHPRPGAGE
jgi:hypothetical protein